VREILQQLIFEGSVKETVKVGSFTFEIKTIDSEKHYSALSNSAVGDMFARTFGLQLEVVGRALVSVNGIIFESEKEALDFAYKLDKNIIYKLHEKYEELDKKVQEKFNEKVVEEIKNS